MTTVTQTPARSPERESLLSRVEELRAVILGAADAAEKDRTLPLSCVNAMRDANLFAMATPRQVGGLELDPISQMEVIEAVARLDSSAGWTLMIGSHGSQVIGTFASDEACSTVFDTASWPIAGSQVTPFGGTFTRAPGGYLVSGRWSFASGIRHADWSMMTVNSVDPDAGGGAPHQIGVVLPAKEVTIEDNWYVAGLKGTGSCDFSLTDVFIPEAMTWKAPPKVVRGGPRYSIKTPQAMLAVFALGLARRSLDEITTQAISKMRPGSKSAVAARPYFQHVLGEAEIRLTSARAGLFQLVDQMWTSALTNGSIPTELHLRLSAMPAFVHGVASDITATALRFGGSSASRSDNILQRNFRDMAVAAQHIQASEQAYEPLGRFVLGIPD